MLFIEESRSKVNGGSRVTRDSRFFFVADESKDFHTKYGYLTAEQMSKNGLVRSSQGKEFSVFNPEFIDYYAKIKRSAQLIPLKDIGQIITTTGINKSSRVIDSGGGSGGLSLFLANIVKEVYTYEIREDFYKIINNNINFLGFDNLFLKKGDAYEGFDEKNVDLITLDLPEPWRAIGSAKRSLKLGGFLFVYNPSIIQIKNFIEELSKHREFQEIKIIESIEREWVVDGRKIRPKNQGIGHSGFMGFFRRIL